MSGPPTAACRFPDFVTEDKNSTQCGSTALCCPGGYTCLSNGLCQIGSDDRTYFRGSCTNWQDPGCSTVCRSFQGGHTVWANQSTVDSGAAIVKYCPSTKYCCQALSDTNDCCAVEGEGTIDPHNVVSISASSTITVAAATPIATISPTTTPSSSSSASTTSSQSSAAASSTSSPSPAQSSSGLSKGAIAGIAVGAVALVAIIAIVAFLLWRRRRKNYKAVRSPTETQQLKRDMGMESMAPIGAGIGAGAAAGAGGIAAHHLRENRGMDSHNDMGHHDHDRDDEAEAGMTEMKPPERITEHPVDSMDSVASASRQRDIQDAADRELEEEGIRPFSPEDLEHGRDSPATGLMENRARDISPER